jgi:hypothetical protein
MLSVSALAAQASARLTTTMSGGSCAAASRASCNDCATTGANPWAANDCANPSSNGSSVPTKRICVMVSSIGVVPPKLHRGPHAL